jgi:hypothetical protein
MSTMTNLYYESNSGSLLPPDLYRFSPIIGYGSFHPSLTLARYQTNDNNVPLNCLSSLVFFSVIGNFFSPELRLENILARFK